MRHQPWNAREFFYKSNKAAILHYLLEDITPEDLPNLKDALFIKDRTTLLHTLINLPPTCGEICLHVLDQMVAKKHFLFSIDSYHPQSIKTLERLRRGSSEKIILAGPATRKPYTSFYYNLYYAKIIPTTSFTSISI